MEVSFVLGDVMTPEGSNLKPTEEDKEISKIMMTYWANFAKHGYRKPGRREQNFQS